MRCGRSRRQGTAALACLLFATGVAPRSESLVLVHRQRYAMGTMFDVIVYDASQPLAARAAEAALAEVERLDRVMSHYNPDSDLSRLVREGRRTFVRVEPALYDVLYESIRFSRLSGGKFDVTIAPLVRVWKTAHVGGRTPGARELEGARQCVGYEKIEFRAPASIRLNSDCIELDLGGIGKGYAADRAMAVLSSAGIRNALINAGGSSIAAIGAPPGRAGWPVSIAGAGPEGRMLLLQNGSVSTSQQDPARLPPDASAAGEVVDPDTGAPASARRTVSVLAATATAADAASTTLLLLPADAHSQFLAGLADVSAVSLSSGGALHESTSEPRSRRVHRPAR